MKSTVLTCLLCIAAGGVLHAQLSFLPQIGFEQARTTLNYNSLSTSGAEGNLRASLKMDYRFKGGHGPYVNLGTSPAPIHFSFDNSGQLVKGLGAAKSNLQFRVETGYQYSSKPIFFGKSRNTSSAASSEVNTQSTAQQKSCGSTTYKASCRKTKNISKTALANNNLNMRLQPSMGFAYVPSTSEGINQTSNGFTYNATNWKTALVPAVGFEFAKGTNRLFTLTVFYTQPLGLQEETFIGSTGTKAITTALTPKASTWGMTVGVPFSFAKANTHKTKKVKKECSKTSYKRCIRIQ